jgi:signal transduction histidine kinase
MAQRSVPVPARLAERRAAGQEGRPEARPESGEAAGKRSFLRMAAHELRTPLNSIIGFSEILSHELYGPLGAPQYREYAEIIRGSGLRMLRLVNQVLEMARLESGQMELDPRVEPLDAVFDDAITSVREEAAARDLRFACEIPSPVPAVLADAKAVRTVVVNLLQNAVAYAPEGGEVRVSARAQGPLVIIEVENDGEGLDPAQLPRLMQPFEQGEHALTRRNQGAGLGWPIVRLLCEAMGGGFEVRTAPGEGLTARATLIRVAG